jgi:uncharacterized protein (TIGR02246 family)
MSAASAQDAKRGALEEVFETINNAVTVKDGEAYASVFVEEGILFLPQRPPVFGRDQIRRWFDDFADAVTLVGTSYEQQQFDVFGDVAIVRSHGTGDYVVESGGERIPANHKFVDILHYRDGRWQMLYHIASAYNMEPSLWDRMMSQAFGEEGRE